MTKSKLGVVLLSVVLGLGSLTACTQPPVECDLDDQVEFDSDCGYFENNQFVWYSWVVRGQVSESPEGWEKPAQADHDEDEDELPELKLPSPRKVTPKATTKTPTKKATTRR